jgi:putative serine protease PepD
MSEDISGQPLYPTYDHSDTGSGSGQDYGGYPPPAYPHPPAGSAPTPPPPYGSDARGRRQRRTIIAAAGVAALIGATVGATTVAFTRDSGRGGGTAGLTFSTQAAPAAKVDGSISAAAATIGPSVVTIKVSSASVQDTGSGVIIRQDGYILTNNHVISNVAGGGSLTVTLKDGRRVSGKVVGTDSSDDLAVVKIAIIGLRAAAFASSASLVVGQTVVAVGAPLGLSDTVTSGIVSNTARPVQTGDGSTQGAVFNAVQTDAAINPGNSGGPLVNLAGAVVGINAAIATDQSQGGLQVPGQSTSGNIGIGFAIPSDEASRIAGELITKGKASHAVLGITVGNPAASSTGATVKSVNANGPAANAGLRAGDIVVRLDTQLIEDANALVAAVRSHAPGDTVTATYRRGTVTHTVTVRLGSASS